MQAVKCALRLLGCALSCAAPLKLPEFGRMLKLGRGGGGAGKRAGGNDGGEGG